MRLILAHKGETMIARLGYTTLFSALALALGFGFAMPLAAFNACAAAALGLLAALALLHPAGRLGLMAALRRFGPAMAAFCALLAYLALSPGLDGETSSPAITPAWLCAAGLGLGWLSGVMLCNGGRSGDLLPGLYGVGCVLSIASLGLGLWERAGAMGGAGLSAFMVLGAFGIVDTIRRDRADREGPPVASPWRLVLPGACYLLAFAAVAAGQMWPAAAGGLAGSAMAAGGLLLRTPKARRANALKSVALILGAPLTILAGAMALAWSGASAAVATTPVPAQTLDAMRLGWNGHAALGLGLAALTNEAGIQAAAAGGVYLAETGWVGVALLAGAIGLCLEALAGARERRRSPPTGFALLAGLTVAAAITAPLSPDLLQLGHSGVFALLAGLACAMADPVRRSAAKARGSQGASTQRL